jgi:CheY-like chemotaxis protein
LALSDQFKCQIFTSAQQAQQFLLANYTQQDTFKTKYLQMDYQDLYEFSVKVSIANIYQEVFNQERFNKTCVLVVDYDMPSMNGLEFARILKSLMPIKIIMLTGEADQQTAIAAFNNQQIDRFVLKSSADYHEKLIAYINELQHEYFLALSMVILNSLSSECAPVSLDSRFAGFFNALCSQYQSVEYYLLDESGSFLILDKAANETWLIVRTPADRETFFELAASEPDISEDALLSIKNNTKLVFFPKKSGQLPSLQEWVFCEATQLQDSEIYYGMLHGEKACELHLERVLSYQAFLDGEPF